MGGTAQTMLEAVASVNWLDVIKTLAAAGTLLVALSALKNWQRQDRAKREAEFLDALVETTLTISTQIEGPCQRLGWSVWNIAGEVQRDDLDDHVGAVRRFIERDQGKAAKAISEVMEPVRAASIRLGTLFTKGQMFRLHNYSQCKVAVMLITEQIGVIEQFISATGTTTWNWEAPQVLAFVRHATLVDGTSILATTNHGRDTILAFAAHTYERLYAGR